MRDGGDRAGRPEVDGHVIDELQGNELRGDEARHDDTGAGARVPGRSRGKLVAVLAALGFVAAAGLGLAVAPRRDDVALPTHDHGTAAGSSYWQAVAGGADVPTGRTRTYYIGADEVTWNYAPAGRNGITGQPFDGNAKTYTQGGQGLIGSSYLKCLYRGYTDASFRSLQQRPAQDAYLGFLGPVIHAEVGDTVKVVFRNGCRIATSIHAHGVLYDKASEGAPYADGSSASTAGDAVAQGRTFTYTWQVPERAGPGPHDGSSVVWMYHSHANEVADTYAGLMGPIVVTARGQARDDGSPKDVDREVFEYFTIDDESQSPYFVQNVQTYTGQQYAPVGDDQFAESNLKHVINGYLFGNQPMLTLQRGDHVRWYLLDMGSQGDLHTPHWHGNDVVSAGMRTDVVSLLPGAMAVADMVPDDAGTWLLHCHVADHLASGMVTRYTVS